MQIKIPQGTIEIKPSPRQLKCNNCGEPYEFISKLGFVCLACKKNPNRYQIVVSEKAKPGQQKGLLTFIYSNKRQQVLSSYELASELIGEVQYEVEHGTFDPIKYRKKDQKEFWTCNLLDRFEMKKVGEKKPRKMSLIVDARGPIAPSYECGVRFYIKMHKKFWQNQDVRDISRVKQREYVEWLIPQEKKKGGLRRSVTIIKIYDHFKVFLNWLKREEIIFQVPTFLTEEDLGDLLNGIAMAEPKRKKVWFDRAGQAKAVETIEEEDKKLITSFLMDHPIRPGECRALQVKDINVAELFLDISKTFSANTLVQRRKGRKSKVYEMPIRSNWIDFFLKKVKDCLPDAFIFSNSNTGKPYDQTTFGEIWREVKRKLKLPNHVRLYDATRHSIATQLRQRNVPLDRIAKQLGHSSTKMVEETYADLDIESMRADLETLSLKPEKVVDLNKKRVKKKAGNE